jgi:hypothetical protein
MHPARHSSKNVLFLLIAVGVLLKSATAQHEVQIMVNGPWAYVATPASPSTIIVATPSLMNHKAVIFSGENADLFRSAVGVKEISVKGANKLVFQGTKLADCKLIPPEPTIPEPKPFPLTVKSDEAKDVITGHLNGFAITLPKPCYSTNFADSRSRIDLTKIDTNPHKAPVEAPYTIWRVLHYSVESPDKLAAEITGANNFNLPFKTIEKPNEPAISIVMGDDQPESDARCDSRSVDSFKKEAELFNNKILHVQFPRLIGPGTQTHDYKPDCIDKRIAPKDVAGAADCRGAQLDVTVQP